MSDLGYNRPMKLPRKGVINQLRSIQFQNDIPLINVKFFTTRESPLTAEKTRHSQKETNELKIVSSYDPEIPLLGIYQARTIIQKDRCTLCVHNGQDLEAP